MKKVEINITYKSTNKKNYPIYVEQITNNPIKK